MIIYIRHGNDQTNTKSAIKYKHDLPISKNSKHLIKKLTHELVEKFGYPTKIYSGPFIRCRDTMMVMINEIIFMKNGIDPDFCLKCYDFDIELNVDCNLSKYSAHLKNKLYKISPTTLNYNIPTKETKNDFDMRLDTHIESMKKNIPYHNIWCVTHAYIYKQIGSKLNINTPSHINFLDYFIYN